MRIDEVKPQDSATLFWKNWLNSMEVKPWIVNAKSNYKEAGSGWFSSVWHSYGSNKVIKLAVADRCWNAYVKWLDETKENPHTPKIYGHREFDSGVGPEFSISVIEKLKSIESIPFDQLIPDGLAFAKTGAEFTGMAYIAEYKASGIGLYIKYALSNAWLRSTNVLNKLGSVDWDNPTDLDLLNAREALVDMIDNSKFAKQYIKYKQWV